MFFNTQDPIKPYSARKYFNILDIYKHLDDSTRTNFYISEKLLVNVALYNYQQSSF